MWLLNVFGHEGFMHALAEVDVNMVAVDEAHCLSPVGGTISVRII